MLEAEPYRYLFKVRRLRNDDPIYLRDMLDGKLYTYQIEKLDRRRALITLVSSRILRVAPLKRLHLAWCQIEPRIVEKAISSLNEIGVSKISFISCDRSQRNFKPDFERLRRILINSSQQCGRSELMELELVDSLESFVQNNSEAMLLDFCKRQIPCIEEGKEFTIVVGCEGGFSPKERAIFGKDRIVGFQTPTILRSETAACAAASRILLG